MIPFAEHLKVVLVSPRNPLNIGAAARAISNFGFTQLRLVNAYDVAYREAKSAVNASAILESAEQYANVADAVKDCSLVIGTTAVGHRELQHQLQRLEAGAREIHGHLPQGPVALLFGSEKFGLGNEEMSYCHSLLRIPTRAEHESMNLGQAVAVCLYELIREGDAPNYASPTHTDATGEQTEMITSLLLEALNRSGYASSPSTEFKVRRMVRRLEMSQRDAHVWLGMWRQILWKLRQHS